MAVLAFTDQESSQLDDCVNWNMVKGFNGGSCLYGFGLERDGLRPRRGLRPHTPQGAAVIVGTPKAGLLRDQPPRGHHVGPVLLAVRRPQTVAVERPASPGRLKCAQVAQAPQAQQPHHGPRNPAPASVPMTHGSQADAEVFSTGFGSQKAAMPEGAKTLGGQVPSSASAAAGSLQRLTLDCA